MIESEQSEDRDGSTSKILEVLSRRVPGAGHKDSLAKEEAEVGCNVRAVGVAWVHQVYEDAFDPAVRDAQAVGEVVHGLVVAPEGEEEVTVCWEKDDNGYSVLGEGRKRLQYARRRKMTVSVCSEKDDNGYSMLGEGR